MMGHESLSRETPLASVEDTREVGAEEASRSRERGGRGLEGWSLRGAGLPMGGACGGGACGGAPRACFTNGLCAHPQTLATNLPARPGGDVAKPSRAAHPQPGCLLQSIAAEWLLEMDPSTARTEPSLNSTTYRLALRTPECSVPLCAGADYAQRGEATWPSSHPEGEACPVKVCALNHLPGMSGVCASPQQLRASLLGLPRRSTTGSGFPAELCSPAALEGAGQGAQGWLFPRP